MKKINANILIVDDNPSVTNSLRFYLKHKFSNILCLNNPNQIPSSIRTEKPDVIILDMNFSAGVNTGNEGIFWLREILKLDRSAIVIMLTAYGDIELAVKAVREGAIDFIVKPWENEKLFATIQSALILRQTKSELKNLQQKQQQLTEDINKQFDVMIGESDAMQQVLKTIDKIAKTDANVLILGENGTGKELIARAIHLKSKRAKDVFITVDIAALSETLLESELFGHTKGAFTNAVADRVGRFETASGGSLFLDEIGNLSLASQAKLLTAIQNREITPIGSNSTKPIDIRLISATNKNINKMVAESLFREDLLYRINTIQIEVPSLRQRGNDIILLADYFLNKYTIKYEKNNLTISTKAKEKLLQYQWPGNVRELQHTIEKAVIMSETDVLTPDDFFFSQPKQVSTDTPLTLDEIEKMAIENALIKHKGNITYAANELNIGRQTLYRKIEKYGLL